MFETEFVERAAHLGVEHGRNAADWLIDGNTDDPAGVLERYIRGLDEGDPAVMDYLPWPDLSGEWADGMTAYRLALECGLDDADLDPDTLAYAYEAMCDAYEDGFITGRDVRVYEMHTHYSQDVG